MSDSEALPETLSVLLPEGEGKGELDRVFRSERLCPEERDLTLDTVREGDLEEDTQAVGEAVVRGDLEGEGRAVGDFVRTGEPVGG